MDIDLLSIVDGVAHETKDHFCPHCGRLVPKREIPLPNGRTMSVQPICECESNADDAEKRIFEQRKRKSDIESKYSALVNSPKYRRCQFGNYEVDKLNKNAYEYALKYAESFYAIEKDLFIHGTPGNGKSHLASAIGNELNGLDTIVVFVTFSELWERIKGTFGANGEENEARIINAICSADLLILDDVGVEKATDYSIDVLYRIVERRTKNYKKTVFTSNYSPSDLMAKYTDSIGKIEAQRVVGRIVSNAIVVRNDSDDRRFRGF